MTIDLVTGASGLLGGNLVRVLVSQGRQVRILIRRTSKTFHIDDIPGLERMEGDITNPSSLSRAFSGVENVYHCAAKVSVRRQMTGDIWQANVTGTENVIQEARNTGIRRLIFCSSVDAIGLPENGLPSSESTPWNWDQLGVENAYARTKLEAQKRVLSAAREGLDAVVVCPTFMLGAYDPHPSSGQLIISTSQNPVTLALKGGNNFVDVEDVVAGMIAAAERGKSGETYILGSENLTYTEIFERISSVLQKRAPKISVPYAAAATLGWLGDRYESWSGKEAVLNSAIARLAFFHHYYDSSKAVRELNFPQRPVTEAIERAVLWFRKVGMMK